MTNVVADICQKTLVFGANNVYDHITRKTK